MKHISVQSFREVVKAEKSNPSVDFINVCTPEEYKEKHIQGVRSVPLAELGGHVDEFKDKKTIYIHCRSGKRGQKAVEELTNMGVTAELVNVEGGLSAWDEAGYETATHTKGRLPIMRQTFIAAGVLVILGYLLATTLHPSFILLSVFVGAGLMVAGITGWCGMTTVLGRMPWNK